MSTSFGTLLRDKRVAARKSLREFARAMNLSATYVSRVERGELPPLGMDRLRSAAAFIGCDVDELLCAAIADRAFVRLDAGPTEAHRAAATALAVHWENLTAQQLDAICAIVEGGQR